MDDSETSRLHFGSKAFVFEPPLDGLRRDPEFPGNLAVGPTLNKQQDDQLVSRIQFRYRYQQTSGRFHLRRLEHYPSFRLLPWSAQSAFTPITWKKDVSDSARDLEIVEFL